MDSAAEVPANHFGSVATWALLTPPPALAGVKSAPLVAEKHR